MRELLQICDGVVPVDHELTDGKEGINREADVGNVVPRRCEGKAMHGQGWVVANGGSHARAERYAPDINGTVACLVERADQRLGIGNDELFAGCARSPTVT